MIESRTQLTVIVMFTPPRISTQIRQEMIVSGYIRLKYKKSGVPSDILKLLQLFSDEVISCSIPIDDVLKLQQDDKLVIETFNVKSLKFELCIEHDEDDEYVIWLRLISNCVSKKASEFQLYYAFCCKELKIDTMKSDKIQRSIMSPYSFNSHIHLYSTNDDLLQLIKKTITFTFYADVLYIKYKDKHKEDKDYNLCQLSRNIKFEWIIDKKFLKQIECAQANEKFYSEIFGLNEEDNIMHLKQYGFCLVIEKSRYQTVSMSLKRVCFPKEIYEIVGAVALNVDGKNMFCGDRQCLRNGCGLIFSLSVHELGKFNLWITIQEIYGGQGMYKKPWLRHDEDIPIIPIGDWEKYGVFG